MAAAWLAPAIATQSSSPARTLAISNATVFPVTSAPIEKGTILIRDGIIAAVGRDVAVPAGAETVDATGMFALPGLVDPHSHLGAREFPGFPTDPKSADPITPHLRARDVFDHTDPAIRRVVAGGVTTAQVLPGSSNVIGGQGVIVKLKPGRTTDEMVFPGAPRVMKMAVGENPKAAYGRIGKMPATRLGEFALLREWFVRAQEYRDRRDRWEAQPAASRKPEPARDPKLEALADVLRGRIDVHIHAYRKDEFLALYRLADEFKFRIASFQHAMEAYKIAAVLAKRGTGASVYADAFGRKIEHWDQVPQTAAFLNASGALVSLHSDFAFFAQRLHAEAAKLVRYGGISEADALKTITINPARIIGVDKQVGSLEVGKHADIALLDRHPFDSFSLVQKTYIDGELVFDRLRNAEWLTSSR